MSDYYRINYLIFMEPHRIRQEITELNCESS